MKSIVLMMLALLSASQVLAEIQALPNGVMADVTQVVRSPAGTIIKAILVTPTVMTVPPFGRTRLKTNIEFYVPRNFKEVYLDQNRTISVLNESVTLDGKVMFYEAPGKIKLAWVRGTKRLVTSVGAIDFTEILLYPSGAFRGGYSRTQFTLNNVTYPADRHILFNENGTFIGLGRWDQATLNYVPQQQ